MAKGLKVERESRMNPRAAEGSAQEERAASRGGLASTKGQLKMRGPLIKGCSVVPMPWPSPAEQGDHQSFQQAAAKAKRARRLGNLTAAVSNLGSDFFGRGTKSVATKSIGDAKQFQPLRWMAEHVRVCREIPTQLCIQGRGCEFVSVELHTGGSINRSARRDRSDQCRRVGVADRLESSVVKIDS